LDLPLRHRHVVEHHAGIVVIGLALGLGAIEIGYARDAAVSYRLEGPADGAGTFSDRFSPRQRAILEKLNRADAAHLPRLRQIVVPWEWHDDELAYSPFPLSYPAAGGKLLVVDLGWQAFAAYEVGRLVRWGPVSSGRRSSPTPDGRFQLNWRSRGRHSTVNPAWFMEWYINFDNIRGLALHSHPLPGYPASHGCIRLLERDAIWMHEWGEAGTPLVIVGQYAVDGVPAWRSLEHLARGIELPDP
jgi:hypothetical protein